MQLNSLRYLIALANERHFARAAQVCSVSQPSLSAGLAALEEQLGRRLVDRDRRFIDLTAEGKAILPWARQVTAALDGMILAASATPGPLRGELRLGSIPAALPVIGAVAAELRNLHSDVRLAVTSLTSREIAARLREGLLDAGVTYVAHEPPGSMITVPLYRERSVFVGGALPPIEPDGRIAWEQALSVPLCLLHQGMQNRRILDASLAERGMAVNPSVTADSHIALLALVRSGEFATIMPDSYIPLLPSWARVVPFLEPVPANLVGLIVPDRSPLNPMAAAALTVAEKVRGE